MDKTLSKEEKREIFKNLFKSKEHQQYAMFEYETEETQRFLREHGKEVDNQTEKTYY